MQQYFDNLIINNKQHILNVLDNFGYSNINEPTAEILLRAYEIHGEQFLSDIINLNSQFSNLEGEKPSVKDWITAMTATISTGASKGKTQGDNNVSDNTNENETEAKKTFWEKTKNLWDKALPAVNSGAGLLNLIDSNLINKKQDVVIPDIDIPDSDKSNKLNVLWYVAIGVGLIIIGIALFIVFRKK